MMEQALSEPDEVPAPTCRILHLEDSPMDRELVAEHLERGGLAASIEQVDTRRAYLEALGRGAFDLILADHSLPAFDGLTALELARTLAPEKPFVFVSGVMEEVAAANALHEGAADFVVKQRLDRLPEVVCRALAEAPGGHEPGRADGQLALPDRYLELEARVAKRTAALAESEARFATYFEAADEWLFDIERGADGGATFRACNPAALRALELAATAIRGRSLEEVLGREAGGQIAEALGRCSDRGTVRVEVAVPTTAGPRAYEMALVGFRGRGKEAGQVVRVLGTARDVTERREAERLLRGEKLRVEQEVLARTRELERTTAELRGREAWLRATLDTAPDAIVVIDHAGTIASVNPAAEALFGYPAARVVDQDISFLIPPLEGQERGEGRVPPAWAGGPSRTGSGWLVRGRRHDGSEFPLELAVGEVANGGPPHFVGFIRDLTARERLEGELRQAQKMEAVGQLTGGVAHDFNNLLTVVLGNLEMLGERLSPGSLDLVLVREAVQAAHAGADLTGRLLAFARLQPLDPKPLDLRREVAHAAALFRRTLGETIQVRTVAPDYLPPALADPGQLQNAVLNLALNARDAMPRGGQLVLEATAAEIDADLAAAQGDGLRPGRYLLLLVTDTGVGMTREVRERAFEPFFTTKPIGAGSGLGLSMVYGFAKQTGGHAQIDSEPGQGTTIRLYLPQAGDAAPVAGEPAAALPAALRGQGETILVVEDDPCVRRYAVARLQALGYRALEAESGPAALRALVEGAAVDLLFTDVVMPGGVTGHDLAQQAARDRPGLRVVFTSGYAKPELLQRGMADGGSWLRKPYTATDLARTLRQALD